MGSRQKKLEPKYELLRIQTHLDRISLLVKGIGIIVVWLCGQEPSGQLAKMVFRKLKHLPQQMQPIYSALDNRILTTVDVP